MSKTTDPKTLTRRDVAVLAAGAAGAAALAASPAHAANQPHMRKSLAYCEAGLVELRAASGNKGGHRATAIEHLEYAIAQIKEGIRFANG